MVYADDTQLYMAINTSDKDERISQLENCIRDVKGWMAANKLKLNDGKTEILHLTLKFVNNVTPLDSLQIGLSVVDAVSKARNLGVIIDDHITLSAHVDNICRLANVALCKIGQIRKFLSRETAEKLVHAFVSSRLDSCNGVLYGLSESELRKLQRVQNSAGRMVALVKKRHHITPVLQELHWLLVRKRIIYKILLLTYKALHGLAPGYIRELLQDFQPSPVLRSSSQCLLSKVRTSTAYGKRSFAAAAPELWNGIPMSLKTAEPISSFKSQLKTYLFRAKLQLV